MHAVVFLDMKVIVSYRGTHTVKGHCIFVCVWFFLVSSVSLQSTKSIHIEVKGISSVTHGNAILFPSLAFCGKQMICILKSQCPMELPHSINVDWYFVKMILMLSRKKWSDSAATHPSSRINSAVNWEGAQDLVLITFICTHATFATFQPQAKHKKWDSVQNGLIVTKTCRQFQRPVTHNRFIPCATHTVTPERLHCTVLLGCNVKYKVRLCRPWLGFINTNQTGVVFSKDVFSIGQQALTPLKNMHSPYRLRGSGDGERVALVYEFTDLSGKKKHHEY